MKVNDEVKTTVAGIIGTATTPEAGTVTNVYDSDSTCNSNNYLWGASAGDLLKSTDNAGNVSCFGYDALHRLRATTYPSGPNTAGMPMRYFAYDS